MRMFKEFFSRKEGPKGKVRAWGLNTVSFYRPVMKKQTTTKYLYIHLLGRVRGRLSIVRKVPCHHLLTINVAVCLEIFTILA